MRAILSIVGLAIFGIFLFLMFGPFYTIDEGERGVITRNGAIVGVAEPGLGMKLPIIESVTAITVRTELATFEKLAAYSKDQQTAEMRVSVNYRILPEQVRNVYSNYGDAEQLATRLIYPRVYEELKTVFGQFTATSAVSDRARLNDEVKAAIAAAVQGPVVIESVQIENIDFSDAYEQGIEQRMLAEVEVQRVRQKAEQAKVDAEITVTQAHATADSAKAAADGQAYAVEKQAIADAKAVELKGAAEASALRAKGDALRDNPALVQLRATELWDGKLPTTFVPGSAVPFIAVK